MSQFNTRSAGVRRLMKEAQEMQDPTDMYAAQPFEDNLFEWHFTVRGPQDSDFEGGIYHGRIVFPSDYPMKPPNLYVLTPNGRFELNKKICLSISGYHPETWLPSWSIRTALLALIGFLPTEAGGAIGALSYPSPERQKLAKRSISWTCKECGLCMKDALLPFDEEDAKACTSEAKQLITKVESAESSANAVISSPEEAPAAAAEEAPPADPVPTRPPRTRNTSGDSLHYVPYFILLTVVMCIFSLLLARRFYA